MEAAVLGNPLRLLIFIVLVVVALVVIDSVKRMKEKRNPSITDEASPSKESSGSQLPPEN